jgi:hypothetical protein
MPNAARFAVGSVIAWMFLAMPTASAQVNFVTVGTPTAPIPEAWFSVQSPNTCSDSSQTLPHEGFVKAGIPINVDAKQTTTGHCDFYYGSTFFFHEWYYPVRIQWTSQPAGGSTSTFQFYGPWPPPEVDPQSYDSRNPGSGNGTEQIYSASGAGRQTFTFQGVLNGTDCSFSPYSNQITKYVNVMTCEPKWAKIGSPAKTHHLAPTKIYIYIPTSMWSVLVANDDGPAVQAKDDWNATLNGTGLEFEITDTSCGSGGNCIYVEETNDSITGCAAFTGGVPNYSTGEIANPSTIKFPAATWDDASAERLRRTMNHEFGHALGMDENTTCSGADSIMGPSSSCTTLGTLSPTPTLQDALQTTTSPYGSGVETKCGF